MNDTSTINQPNLAGYTVTPKHAPSRVYECPRCLAGHSDCPCFVDALRFVRSFDGGGTIHRGSTLLSSSTGLTPEERETAKLLRAERRAKRNRQREESDSRGPR